MEYRKVASSNYFKACARCGETENLHVHHKNRNHEDNRKENLVYLCRACHEFIHGKNLGIIRELNKGNSWRRDCEWNRRR